MSTNLNNGVIHGLTWTTGGKWQSTNALYFDKNLSHYVDCGSDSSLDAMTSTLSLEAWVWCESINDYMIILGKSENTSWAGAPYMLALRPAGQPTISIGDGSGNDGTGTSASSLTTGTWHHVVGTFDGTTISIYVDGALAHSKDSSLGAILSSGAFYLGLEARNGGYFEGKLDEVRVYHRALTDDEVLEHYHTTNPQENRLFAADAVDSVWEYDNPGGYAVPASIEPFL